MTNVLYNEIMNNLDKLASKGDSDGNKVLKLKDIISEVKKKPNVANYLMMEILANDSLYDKIFVSEFQDGSTGRLTKSMLQKVINQLSTADQEKVKTAFSKMYFAQSQMDKLIPKLGDEEKHDSWSNTGSQGWIDMIKDKYIFSVLQDAGTSILAENAQGYSYLKSDVGVNSMKEYTALYLYMFATKGQYDELVAYGVNIDGLSNAETMYNEVIGIGSFYRDVIEDVIYYIQASHNVRLTADARSENTLYTKVNGYGIGVGSRDDLLKYIFAGKIDVASYLAAMGKSAGKTYVLKRDNTSANRGNPVIHTDFNSKGDTNVGKLYITTKARANYQTNFYKLTNTSSSYIGTYTLEIYKDSDWKNVAGKENILTNVYNDMMNTGLYNKGNTNVIPIKAKISGNNLYIYETNSKEAESIEGWYYLSSGGVVSIKKSGSKYYIDKSYGKDKIKTIYWVSTQEKNNTAINVHYGLQAIYGEYDQLNKSYDTTAIYNSCLQQAKAYNTIIDQMESVVRNNTDFKDVTLTSLNDLKGDVEMDYGDDYESCRDIVDVGPTCTDGWWVCAYNFFKTGMSKGQDLSDAMMVSELQDLIFDIGNMIFILITAFLGVKYIWGSSESKFTVKTSLVTLVVAAMVFYGWNAITNIVNIKDLLTGTTASTGYQNFAVTIYEAIMYVINVAAIGGIIYLGVKYMMAGADGKAELKVKLIPVIMGIIMVYGTVNLIGFILDITVRSL